MQCPECRELIEKLPCPHCGYDEEKLAKEGGTDVVNPIIYLL